MPREHRASIALEAQLATMVSVALGLGFGPARPLRTIGALDPVAKVPEYRVCAVRVKRLA